MPVSGPLFDGRLIRAMDDAVDEINKAVGRRGVSIITSKLNVTLKRQTGRFVSTIKVKKGGAGVLIDGEELIYGRWLEGTGSRNAPKTIFKGYGTFAYAYGVLDRQAQAIAENIVRKKLEALG